MILTEPQIDILELFCQGKEIKQIAYELNISKVTLFKALAKLHKIFNSNNKLELIHKYTVDKIQKQISTGSNKYARVNDLDDILELLAKELGKYHYEGQIDFHASNNQIMQFSFKLIEKNV
jgi:DNA-binding CsgD family transcriptional regulator